jgi:hypothetical protein
MPAKTMTKRASTKKAPSTHKRTTKPPTASRGTGKTGGSTARSTGFKKAGQKQPMKRASGRGS